MLRLSSLFALGVSLALGASATGAVAQVAPAPAAPPADAASDAAALKAKGDAHMDALEFADALARYRAAYELSGDPALLYNQGRAHEKMGQFPEALDLLRRFSAEAPPALRARVPDLDALIAEVAGRTTVLSVKTTPAGATVRMGDRVLGPGPIEKRRVNAASRVRLEVSAEGFDTDARDVDLPGGRDVALDVRLVPRDKRAFLTVTSPVAGARIDVDGRALGQVPADVRLEPGTHRVRVTADGYEENLVEVVLGVAERRALSVEPNESPVYTRWWFWTLGGVAVAGAGAGVLTYALLTEQDADTGSIPPGQASVESLGRRRGAPAIGVVVPVIDVRF